LKLKANEFQLHLVVPLNSLKIMVWTYWFYYCWKYPCGSLLRKWRHISYYILHCGRQMLCFQTIMAIHIAVHWSHWSALLWNEKSRTVPLNITTTTMRKHVQNWCCGEGLDFGTIP